MKLFQIQPGKENSRNLLNSIASVPVPAKQTEAARQASPAVKKPTKQTTSANRAFLKLVTENVADSLSFSAVEDLSLPCEDIRPNSFVIEERDRNPDSEPLTISGVFKEITNNEADNKINDDHSLITLSSATELYEPVLDLGSDTTVFICEDNEDEKRTASVCEVDLDRPVVSLSFGVTDCENVNVITNRVDIKKISFSHKDKNVFVDCDIVELSQFSKDSNMDRNMTEVKGNTLKRSAVTVNLEIKKKKLVSDIEDATEDTKLLILNTNAIEKVTHVIVQPPNYKLVKRKLSASAKSVSKTVSRTLRENANVEARDTLKQASITAFFKRTDAQFVVSRRDSKSDWLQCNNVTRDEAQEMNKNLSVYGALKSDHVVRSYNKNSRNELSLSARSTKLPLKNEASPKRQTSSSEAHSACLQMTRNHSGSSYSPAKKTGDSAHAPASSKSKSKGATASRSIPNHKIVAGKYLLCFEVIYGDFYFVRIVAND